jgi:hypothetical protein
VPSTPTPNTTATAVSESPARNVGTTPAPVAAVTPHPTPCTFDQVMHATPAPARVSSSPVPMVVSAPPSSVRPTTQIEVTGPAGNAAEITAEPAAVDKSALMPAPYARPRTSLRGRRTVQASSPADGPSIIPASPLVTLGVTAPDVSPGELYSKRLRLTPAREQRSATEGGERETATEESQALASVNDNTSTTKKSPRTTHWRRNRSPAASKGLTVRAGVKENTTAAANEVTQLGVTVVTSVGRFTLV